VKGGRIACIGRVDGPARRTIDAAGAVVTPGFIDVHTHYDAQLDWDPTTSPASWHGVTTVLCGNCGFTLAPARPEDTGWLAQMLSRVEGMAGPALAEGLRWTGSSFGDFWRRVEGRIGVNAGGYVGHSAVRRWVMSDAASERRATAAEITAMQDLVRAAMREGAIGFSTSQLDIHVAHDGREVPSNHASPEEVVALASVLGEFGHGAIEIIPRSFVDGLNDADRELLLAFANEAWRAGARIHPMFATNKLGAHLTLGSTFLFDEIPSFRDALTATPAERERRLRDPAVRERMRQELADPTGRAFVFVWDVVSCEAVRDAANSGWIGKTVPELAAERGQDPLDCFLDVSLAEGLETQFALEMPPSDYFRECTARIVRDPIVMAGSSDGGAHLLSFTGADYPTRLIAEFVPDVLSLEDAVRKLTAIPAAVHGIRDRGVLREGAWADLLAALQVQAREIAKLRHQFDRLSRRLAHAQR
jgi:N-acyl-D-aspartate/D-glutamate deacylase